MIVKRNNILYQLFLLIILSLSSCRFPYFVRKKTVIYKCPRGMALVDSKRFKVRICVDIYEYSLPSKTTIERREPLGYQSQTSCRQHCRKQKKRLLTHWEWRAACEGTKPDYCNIYRQHPILRKVNSKQKWVYKGVNCKTQKNRWSRHCMSDPSLNQLPNGLSINRGFSKCVSKYGIYNMVGNLGEWVDGSWLNKKKKRVARFNGGLYPQNKSSCNYSTIAHDPNYSDYSTGCRCAKDF